MNKIVVRQEIERRTSQRDRILQLFQDREQLTNLELGRISYRYSARLGELRKSYKILCEYMKPGIYRYTYKGPRDDV